MRITNRYIMSICRIFLISFIFVFVLTFSQSAIRAEDNLINKKVNDFDRWVFDSGKIKTIEKIALETTKVRTFFPDNSFSGSFSQTSQFLWQIKVLPRMNFLNFESSDDSSVTLSDSDLSKSYIHITSIDLDDYKKSKRVISDRLAKIKGGSTKIKEYEADSRCKMVKYTTKLSEPLAKFLPFSKNKWIVYTLAYTKFNDSMPALGRSFSRSCMVAAILFHSGLSNAYTMAISQPKALMEQVIPQSNNKNGSESYNITADFMFPLFALARPEIRNGMTRKEALQVIRKLLKAEIAAK